MCGRFSPGSTDLKTEYRFKQEVKIEPRYNISPGSEVPVIIFKDDRKVLKWMRWGFQFVKEGVVQTVINAKGETTNEKPIFQKSLHSQRCFIPATGFCE